MEAKHACLTTCTHCANDFRNNLLSLVKDILRKHGIDNGSVCLNQRTRDLKDGDFVIPRGCIQNLSSTILTEILDELKRETEKFQCPLRRIETESKFYSFAFYLNRPLTFQHVLSSFCEDHLKPEEINGKCILLNHGVQLTNPQNLTLELLRSIIVIQHLLLLLQYHGYNVKITTSVDKILLERLIEIVRLEREHFLFCDGNKLENRTVQMLIGTANNSSYKEDKLRITHNASGDSRPCDDKDKEQFGSSLTINLKKYIEKKKYAIGKGCFDKNINLVDVGSEKGPSEILQQVARIQHCVTENEDIDTVIHITPDSQQFTQQKVHLLMQLLNEESDRKISQVHLTFGQVKHRKGGDANTDMDAEQFYKLRYNQAKEAAVMKYGDLVQGSGWEDTIHSLTTASLKFEFLQTVCRSMVKLDLSKNEATVSSGDNRVGSFVMYNCARLSTLFVHFEEGVQKGLYPPLPDIKEVDFSTLREEEEWYLFFQYIFTYKDLLKQTVEEVIPESGEIQTKIHTHKICNFLIQLSHHLSSYYSRTHVLGDSRPHLMSKMFARLYLLKCVHKMMVHGLGLMGISALNQL